MLKGFDIRMNPTSAGLPFKFYVYAWDEVSYSATGSALFVSAEKTTGTPNQYSTYGVTGLNVSLMPNQKYVLLASTLETLWISPEYARWAIVDNSAYSGVAMMAAAVAKDPAQPLRVLPLTMPRLMRPAGVMWRRSRNLTPGAQLLVSCLKEVANQP